MTKVKVLNTLLMCTFFIGQLPTLFFGSTLRYNLSFFIERSTRIDFFAMYYCNAINFLILAGCLHFNKFIDKRVSLFVFLVTIINVVHLMLFAKRGFGMSKIGIIILLYMIIRYVTHKRVC